jgi:hypothetical protein
MASYGGMLTRAIPVRIFQNNVYHTCHDMFLQVLSNYTDEEQEAYNLTTNPKIPSPVTSRC